MNTEIPQIRWPERLLPVPSTIVAIEEKSGICRDQRLKIKDKILRDRDIIPVTYPIKDQRSKTNSDRALRTHRSRHPMRPSWWSLTCCEERPWKIKDQTTKIKLKRSRIKLQTTRGSPRCRHWGRIRRDASGPARPPGEIKDHRSN